MKYIIGLLFSVLIVCCTSSDNNQPLTSLIGTFVFNGGPTGDTVQWRFVDDSVLYEKLNSWPEVRLQYSFRNPYLISYGVDSSPGFISYYGSAGKVNFNESSFDINFAHVFKANVSNQLNATWVPLVPWDGPGDTIDIIGDSMMVEYQQGFRDTTYISVTSDRILNRGSSVIKYEYKMFSDTLFLMYWKIWRFNKI